MMNSSKQGRDLEKILKQAYAQKEKHQIGVKWQAQVIRRIREQREYQSTPSFFESFAKFTWRFAPYICMLTLILSAVLIGNFTSGDEAYQLLTNGTEEISFEQIF